MYIIAFLAYFPDIFYGISSLSHGEQVSVWFRILGFHVEEIIIRLSF